MRVLLSIKPEYALKILDGSKKFEYRRKLHKNQGVTTVVIYATKPIGKVVGEFEIAELVESLPCHLWERTKSESGISKEFFECYFADRKTAYEIKIGRVTRYKRRRQLSAYLPSGVAPQSFAYI